MSTGGLKWEGLSISGPVLSRGSTDDYDRSAGLLPQETPAREVFLERLKQAIEDGIYSIDNEALADRLIETGAIDDLASC